MALSICIHNTFRVRPFFFNLYTFVPTTATFSPRNPLLGIRTSSLSMIRWKIPQLNWNRTWGIRQKPLLAVPTGLRWGCRRSLEWSCAKIPSIAINWRRWWQSWNWYCIRWLWCIFLICCIAFTEVFLGIKNAYLSVIFWGILFRFFRFKVWRKRCICTYIFLKKRSVMKISIYSTKHRLLGGIVI